MSVGPMEEVEKEVPPARPAEKEAPAPKPEAPEKQPDSPGVFRGKGDKLDQSMGAGEWILIILSYLLLILTFPLSIWLCLKVINEYEQAVILRLGHIRKGGPVRPGVYFILPCVDILVRVDMRSRLLNLPTQEILTKDPLSLEVNGAVYYRIQDPALAVRKVADPDSATLILTQTTLGNILGTKFLSQIISNRETISQSIQSIVDNAIGAWGITVEQVEIMNVKTKVKSQLEQSAAKHAGNWSPASSGSGGSAPHLQDKAGLLEGRTENPRTMKEASITITGSPTSLKFHCVQTEVTGGITHQQTSTRYVQRPFKNEALTDAADLEEVS